MINLDLQALLGRDDAPAKLAMKVYTTKVCKASGILFRVNCRRSPLLASYSEVARHPTAGTNYASCSRDSMLHTATYRAINRAVVKVIL
jgi:hypothetical protein